MTWRSIRAWTGCKAAAQAPTWSATWVVPAGIRYAFIECWGVGGGGGSGDGSTTGGLGGDGGAYGAGYCAVTPGASHTITVGVGGVTRKVPGTAGALGSSTSCGSLVTAGFGSRGGAATDGGIKEPPSNTYPGATSAGQVPLAWIIGMKRIHRRQTRRSGFPNLNDIPVEHAGVMLSHTKRRERQKRQAAMDSDLAIMVELPSTNAGAAMVEVKLDLSEDCETAMIELPSPPRFSASELEGLIRELGRLRASMSPSIPAQNMKNGTVTSSVPAIRWQIIDDDMPAQCRLYLLHPGFGWLHIHLDAPSFEALANGARMILDAPIVRQ